MLINVREKMLNVATNISILTKLKTQWALAILKAFEGKISDTVCLIMLLN